MTIDYKANTFTMAILHKVLEYCYTGTLPFDTMEIGDLLVCKLKNMKYFIEETNVYFFRFYIEHHLN